ncbi:peptidoglycan editing factor PgeF [Virgibacillus sp. NKC19-16]|uniref:peptidoglycan editing factor PgeF n=1 Tax=Virgibacillus salidurans TaxID=2831673 RepID=UPI001F446ABD|nr:peptidoglycan editing factor PgeF [Virgibacillus sp. NKC19-16]UJL47860.1 peptidoglycan editing factor PgeF [Virgibacillus sp. NKC19-16]
MTEPFKQSNESYLHIEKWQKLNPKLHAGFTTRNGGVSQPPFDTLNCGLHVQDEYDHVNLNRQILAKHLTIPLKNWVAGEQTHQTTVKIVGPEDKGKGAASHQSSIKSTDGLITKERGILCTAFFADCVPLYFFDPKHEFIGIAHAGWKGSVNRIGGQMVQKLQTVGVNPADLLVAIGPCISQQCYEVDENVIRHLTLQDREKTVISRGNNRYLLDLKQLNVEILLQCGVLRNNIDVTNYCTFQDDALFFSHRRDKGKTGRMLGFLGFTT